MTRRAPASKSLESTKCSRCAGDWGAWETSPLLRHMVKRTCNSCGLTTVKASGPVDAPKRQARRPRYQRPVQQVLPSAPLIGHDALIAMFNQTIADARARQAAVA